MVLDTNAFSKYQFRQLLKINFTNKLVHGLCWAVLNRLGLRLLSPALFQLWQRTRIYLIHYQHLQVGAHLTYDFCTCIQLSRLRLTLRPSRIEALKDPENHF